ncbi:protein of unknown function DUF214 [Methanolacinia petrolearia DSM 11571]|uniref:ABC3 transporter permease protein domain-containing protein n=1 Tax=Methanolacinia petrolearia (strain DSM 11571 / OCM 486 / SEBR 4847) TaxID=679926 RepID=E1RKK2_METP4|nr:FtsX-like permease family protein [Methanolacinia petrolearia]ADN35855.1 protein of unknown function DUF214 [Methanolacinia petrolearia DSM 11571]
MINDLKVSLFLAIKTLQRGSAGSTILTVIIIAMVFTNMILLPSIITGTIKDFEDKSLDYYFSNVIIEPKGDNDENMFITNTGDLVEELNRVPGVLRASPRYVASVVLKQKGKRLLNSVNAVVPRDEILVSKVKDKMVEGQYLGDNDRGEIIIGKLLAGNRDESEDLIPSLGGVRAGDSITIEFTNGVTKEYRIKGIFSTGLMEVDTMAFITWTDLEEVYGEDIDEASAVYVKAKEGISEKEVKTAILQSGVHEKVKTWREFLGKAYGRVVQSYGIINDMTMIVSLVIAIVVIFIVIMIKTINNRRQIGIMKAIGLKKSIIINNYLFQVMILSILGTILGTVILGLLTGYFSVYPIKFPEGDIVPYIRFTDIIGNGIVLLVSAAVAGYIPAWRIASEDILKAMRG